MDEAFVLPHPRVLIRRSIFSEARCSYILVSSAGAQYPRAPKNQQ